MKRWIVAALCLAATVAQARTFPWTIFDLGALGVRGSVATAVNNRGDVAGYSRASPGSKSGEVYHGVLWQNGVMLDLGIPQNGGYVEVRGINENGAVVANDAFGNGHIWKDGMWAPMNFHGTPKAINRVDMVAGTFNLGAGQRAFLWKSGVATELGTLGGSSSRASAINDAGVVVGNALLAGDATTHAFLYQNGQMRDLGTLGGAYSSANDINSFGVVVGSAQDASGRMLAFMHDAMGMRPLLESTATSSAAAINDRGAVVGLIDDGAFLYDNGVVTRLDQLPEVRAAGWIALFPSGINERGWITGWGWHADGTPGSAFLLIPPAIPRVWSR